MNHPTLSIGLSATELQSLGIGKENFSSSTGSTHTYSNQKQIESFSPVDGQLIAAVGTTTTAEYENLMQQANRILFVFDWNRYECFRYLS